MASEKPWEERDTYTDVTRATHLFEGYYSNGETIRKLCREGEVKAEKINGMWWIDIASLEEYYGLAPGEFVIVEEEKQRDYDRRCPCCGQYCN